MNYLYNYYKNSYPSLDLFTSKKIDLNSSLESNKNLNQPATETANKIQNGENTKPVSPATLDADSSKLIDRTTHIPSSETRSDRSNNHLSLVKNLVIGCATIALMLKAQDYTFFHHSNQNGNHISPPESLYNKSNSSVFTSDFCPVKNFSDMQLDPLNYSNSSTSSPESNLTYPSTILPLSNPSYNLSDMQLVPYNYSNSSTSSPAPNSIYPSTILPLSNPSCNLSDMQLVPYNYSNSSTSSPESNLTYPSTILPLSNSSRNFSHMQLVPYNYSNSSTSSPESNLTYPSTILPLSNSSWNFSHMQLVKYNHSQINDEPEICPIPLTRSTPAIATLNLSSPNETRTNQEQKKGVDLKFVNKFLKKVNIGVEKFNEFLNTQLSEGPFEVTFEQFKEMFGFDYRSLSASQQRKFYEHVNKALKTAKNNAFQQSNETRHRDIAYGTCSIRKNLKLFTRQIGPEWSQLIAERIDLERSNSTDGYDCEYYAKLNKYNWTKFAEKACGPNPDVSFATQILDWVPNDNLKAGIATVCLDINKINDQWNQQELSDDAKETIAKIGSIYNKMAWGTTYLFDFLSIDSLSTIPPIDLAKMKGLGTPTTEMPTHYTWI